MQYKKQNNFLHPTPYTLHPVRGFGLFEIVIASAILSIVLFAMVSLSRAFVFLSREHVREAQAMFLVEEGLEALRSMRDEDWNLVSGLSSGTTYGLEWNGSHWRATTSTETVASFFTRSFEVETAYRDGTSDLATSGSSDADTRKVRVAVSWLSGSGTTTTRTLETYYTNFHNN